MLDKEIRLINVKSKGILFDFVFMSVGMVNVFNILINVSNGLNCSDNEIVFNVISVNVVNVMKGDKKL